MRPRKMNFEQLVRQNKQELLNDEQSITQLELRLERKQEEKSKKERKEDNKLRFQNK